MVCTRLANVCDFNPNRCILCNRSTSQSDDFVLVGNRGLATLKDLSTRWEKLPKEIWPR